MQETKLPPSESVSCWKRPCVQYFFWTLLALLIIGFLVLLLILMPAIVMELQFFFAWIAQNSEIGYIIYILADIVMITLFLPNTLFSIVAAFSFKQAIGFTKSMIFTTMACFISSVCGAVVCFLLGRHCCRETIRKRAITRNKYLKALDNGIKTNGIRLVILLRLAIFIPFTLVSYALGTTGISLTHYTLGSLSMIIVLFFQVFLGCSILDLSAIVQGHYKGSVVYKTMLISGIVLTVGILVVLLILTKYQLKKMERQETREQEDDSLLLVQD